MNRRGFLASLLAIPAAVVAVLRPESRLWVYRTSSPPEWTPIEPIKYTVKPFLKYQREEIAKIFRIPPELIVDEGRSTFAAFEDVEAEFVKTKTEWFRGRTR